MEGTDDKVKLKVNIIIDGQMHRRDEIIDRSIIPERLRSKRYYARMDVEDTPPTPPTPTLRPVSSKEIEQSKRRIVRDAIPPHKLRRQGRTDE